jgi:pyrimidine operon attenuation protein/uracil phosphoribosyltransferase
MAFDLRRLLLAGDEFPRTLEAMASRIHEANPDDILILLGIERRGAPLAERLAAFLRGLGREVLVGKLDINLYRDDLTLVASQPIVRRTELPTSIEERDVILVDDVLYTGRTVRAAMEALNDYGRVRSLKLAVLVDRGGRELPIEANFVGMRVEASEDEIVEVRVSEVDGTDDIRLLERR